MQNAFIESFDGTFRDWLPDRALGLLPPPRLQTPYRTLVASTIIITFALIPLSVACLQTSLPCLS